MIRTPFSQGWSFRPNQQMRTVPQPVSLPHDFIIAKDTTPDAPAGAATGFYPGGWGVYEKRFHVPADWEKVIVAFDGVFCNAEVSVNGHLVTMQPNGYIPFHADLTPYVYFGDENRLEVIANNTAQPNSRWYTGGGIYRHVSLLHSARVHLAPWSIFAHTDGLTPSGAKVMVEVTAVNETTAAHTIEAAVTLVDAAGNTVATGAEVGYILAGEQVTVRVPLMVAQPHLWDVDDPYLYTVKAELREGDAAVDTDKTTFGIRTIAVDSKNGFLLNGRSIKLKGGCIHHDNGIIGSASFADSEYRKLKLHKDNGYNAVRCAHNPPSTVMLDACDRLGLLVIDEAFDVWRMQKVTNDYHLYFEQWWQRDMDAFITRDRNHPCIVMWSTGNEIVERGGLGTGYALAQQLADHVRTLDATRPVTNALCSMWNGVDDKNMALRQIAVKAGLERGEPLNDLTMPDSLEGDLTIPFAAPLDVAGYNYLEKRYVKDGQRAPHLVICGTETYPMQIDRMWALVEELPHVIGDFTWTSFDYLGEAGIGKSTFLEEGTRPPMGGGGNAYPWRTANDADFDICGFDRPQLHYRKIVWGSDETCIAVHDPAGNGKREFISAWGWPQVQSHWNWAGYEGEPVRVDVYSRGDEVELIANGVSVGRAPAGAAERFTAKFELPYAPGTLEAVSYRDGTEISRQRLTTTGSPATVRITLEPGAFVAGEQSLAYAVVELLDAEGNRVPDAAVHATATVTGAATLQAFGSARPATDENYTAGAFTSYEGRWQAILRSGAEPGAATLRVEAEGLAPAELTLDVQ